MTPEEAAALLRRTIVAEHGEARAEELAGTIRATAEAMALVMGEPIDLTDEDPDFARPLP